MKIQKIMSNYPPILFNVQNWEGFAENWEEAYKLASEGVDFCIANGNTYLLPDFFYDKGWNAIQLGRKEEGRKCIIASYGILKAKKAYDLIDSSMKMANELLGAEFAISKEDFKMEFSFGTILREARERLGLSQEDLCNNVIAVSTLSKIENGQQNPSRKVRDYLCQKTGISTSLIPAKIRKGDAKKSLIEDKVLVCMATSDFGFGELIEEYKELCGENPSTLERQFYMFSDGVLHKSQNKDYKAALDVFFDALNLSFPQFSLDIDLSRHFLSNIEILLINNISLCLYNSNTDKLKAMDLMWQLKSYFEEKDAHNPHYAIILFNVQNWEGFAGNWEEAYRVSKLGVDFCVSRGYLFTLPPLLFDTGWNLLHLDRKEEGRVYILRAYSIDKVMGRDYRIENTLCYVNELLGEKLAISKDIL